MSSDTAKQLVTNMLAGDRRSLARIITIVENRGDDVSEILAQVHPHMKTVPVIGITGPPGAGKSTIADKLITRWRARGETVAGILVDPSSPFSGGAVLGDRIRMQEHAADSGVFLRSLSTRGVHGGVSRATHQVAKLFAAAGYDRVLIETVGVGQTELDIMTLADTTVIVLVPEAGDTIQTMKAGLFEIGDIFVVNKADRGGAERIAPELVSMVEMGSSRTPQMTEEELKHHLSLPPVDGDTNLGDATSAQPGGDDNSEWNIPVLLATALKDEGMDAIIQAIDAHASHLDDSGEHEVRRRKLLRREFLDLLVEAYARKLDVSAAKGKLSELLDAIESGEENPYSAIEKARGFI